MIRLTLMFIALALLLAILLELRQIRRLIEPSEHVTLRSMT